MRLKKVGWMTLVLGIMAGGAVAGGSTSWSYANYSYGSYVPKSGSYTEGISNSRLWGKTTFAFDASNITEIKDYNVLGKWNTLCVLNSYVTIDQSAVPDGNPMEISAYSVATTLPSPKLDIEDSTGDGFYEETEAVGLGSLTAGTNYYIESHFDDYRDGSVGDSGKIQAQFAMSQKGWSDYNNCVTSSDVQIKNSYGRTKGST